MPIPFAFTPAILFQGKTVSIPVNFESDMPFAQILKVNVEEGQPFSAGDVIAELMVDNKILKIETPSSGNAISIRAAAGGLINSGNTLIEGEIPASAGQIFSSLFSAVLGTIAFSAPTRLFWIRCTTIPEWLILAAATVLLYWPTFITDGIDIALVTRVWFMQKRSMGEAPLAPAT